MGLQQTPCVSSLSMSPCRKGLDTPATRKLLTGEYLLCYGVSGVPASVAGLMETSSQNILSEQSRQPLHLE
jgi:hypothetical protein